MRDLTLLQLELQKSRKFYSPSELVKHAKGIILPDYKVKVVHRPSTFNDRDRRVVTLTPSDEGSKITVANFLLGLEKIKQCYQEDYRDVTPFKGFLCFDGVNTNKTYACNLPKILTIFIEEKQEAPNHHLDIFYEVGTENYSAIASSETPEKSKIEEIMENCIGPNVPIKNDMDPVPF